MKQIYLLLSIVLTLNLIGCTTGENLYTSSYEGVVINSLTNETFEGISVRVTDGSNIKLSTTSNHLGKFSFSLNPEELSEDYYIQVGNKDTENKQIQIIGFGRNFNDLGIIEIAPDTKPICKITELRLVDSVIEIEGEIQSSGYTEIKSVGFIVSSDRDMTSKLFTVKCSLSGNSFTAKIDEKNLTDDSSFFFFAYAENTSGISYSEGKQLNNIEINPVVRWRSNKETFDYNINVINETATTLTIRAYVANNGDSELVECGFCWSEDGIPAINGSHKSIIGGVVGEYYTITIDELTPITTYFIRPYVKNRVNAVGYGQTIYLTTEYLPAPQVSIESKMTAGTNQIDCNGSVSYSYCSLQEVGFCYSTHSDPKVSDFKVKADKPDRLYTCSLTNLNQGTTYYVRPYIITIEGEVFYGITKTIDTLLNVKITVVDPYNNPIPNASVSFAGGPVNNVNTYKYYTDVNGIVNPVLEVSWYKVFILAHPYSLKILDVYADSTYIPMIVKMSD